MVRHLFAKCKNVVVSECALSPEWPGGTDRSRASGWTDEQRNSARMQQQQQQSRVHMNQSARRWKSRAASAGALRAHLFGRICLISHWRVRAYRIPQQKFGGVRH